MFFVFGLGNPGLKYKNTRHNAGWCAVDVLAKRHGIKLKKTKFDALAGQGMIGGQKVILAKPTTFMNNSGYAVDGMLDYYDAGLENLIVMYDDIDIPFGSLRIRDKGSAGTHNGMRSILGYTKSGDFTRIRIGIGKPRSNLVGHVLGKFEKEKRGDAQALFERAADACERVITDGVNSAQAEFNK
ncbi:aminoacyl-tRNA hydrolase [Christensenella timonensis]|uniref:aminoacyl-tRNA hydrolase n=1 Tax=Christensenella timonensis TaxID=1816678 RepID=UPI0008308EC1|nr:aminoacyl-tRNA hydrolase [Christensenella timonensis]